MQVSAVNPGRTARGDTDEGVSYMNKIRLFDQTKDYESYETGQQIFAAGDEADVMYVVLEGGVTISHDEVVIDRVEAGGIFGEMALIDDSPRSADAWADGGVKLVPVSRERFHKLVTQTPHFALQVMSIMADRLRRLMP